MPYARGRFRGEGEEDAIIAAIRAGWTAPNPAFRRMFSMLFLPNGTPEQMAWHEDLLRRSTTAEAAARLYRAFLGTDTQPSPPMTVTRLSGRQFEVLKLVSEGLTNEAIADRMCLSVRRVERHLTNIYAKLHVSGKAGRAATAALFVQLYQPPRFSAR